MSKGERSNLRELCLQRASTRRVQVVILPATLVVFRLAILLLTVMYSLQGAVS